MAMLSTHPLRSSLSVAPLSLGKNGSAAGDDAYYHQQAAGSSASSTSGSAITPASTVYTPPATPNGSDENLAHVNHHRQLAHAKLQQQQQQQEQQQQIQQQYNSRYEQQQHGHYGVAYTDDSQEYAHEYSNYQNYTHSAPVHHLPAPVFHNFLRAYYAFHPSHSAGESTVTLPMREGDVILVHSIHTNGWADGTLLASGARGWLPTNYCDAYDPEEMRSLLNALLNFWDLMRSTTVNDSEIFGNQEFMKGIIAGVRYLLERTQCLTRESSPILRHDGLRRCRKSLLSELSSLVKSAKRLQDLQRAIRPTENANDIVDEMILKAFKIVTKGVRFFDVLEDDRRQRAPAVSVMATVVEVNSAPPTPPADAVTFNGASQQEAQQSTDMPSSEASTSGSLAATAPVNKRLSAIAHNYNYHNHRLSSSSLTHRVSLSGPSPLSQPQNLVSSRLSDRHDTFLSYLGSFIGRLHLQSQSRPHLALATKQSATSGGELLVVIDVVSAHNTMSQEILYKSRVAMCNRIVDLVCLARDILTSQLPDVDDVIMPQDNGRLLTAATNCVKATGECVAKTKWVIERVGDFEYHTDDTSPAFDFNLDLSVLDEAASEHTVAPATTTPSLSLTANTATDDEQRPLTAGGSASVVDSVVSSSVSDFLPPSLITSASATSSPSKRAARSKLSVDKPLPNVPVGITSPVEEKRLSSSQRRSLSLSAAGRPSSLAATDDMQAVPTMAPPAPETAQPRSNPLPALPRLATDVAGDEQNATEATESTELVASFHSESLTALSSGTTSTYASRGSESSLHSQTSTRATTPENGAAPKNQISLSDLSVAGSSTVADENDEDVESRLLERTYAHELMLNKEGQVTGGTLAALVERLTTHESTPDAMFVSTFYLTFRLFCTPMKLTEALIDRFEYVGESPSMAGPVRLRVYNAFKGWLESHWREESDHVALTLIVPFAEKRLGLVLPSAGRRLLELTKRVSTSDGSLVPRLVSSMGKTSTSISQYVPPDTPLPAPILSKSLQHGLANYKLGGTAPIIMDFDPLEMARQITLRQMSIFCSILPEELLGSQWMKKGGVGSPNVKAMTALSTDISNLVADTILQYSDVKKRAAVIKQWIKIAQQCYELNNYDALMAIICSLNSSTITRLRRTWDMVSTKRRETLKMMQAIVETSNNNKVLRGRLHDHVPPCLPFLGMYLTDLAFNDIGNPATKQLPGQDGGSDESQGASSSSSSGCGLTVVNFDKHTRTAKIIGELQRFQIPYRLVEVPDVQEWLTNQITRVRELEAPGNNVQVSYYRKSLLLEPRETQMAKVADSSASMMSVAAPSIKESGGSRTDLFAWMRGGIAQANSAGATSAAASANAA